MPVGPFSAFGYPFRGLRLIFSPGFRRYAVIPLLINFVLFSALGTILFSHLGPWIDHILPAGGWRDYLRWLIWPLAAGALVLVGYFAFTVVGNLIAAPFNDLLTARILSSLEDPGTTAAAHWLTWRDAWVSMRDEVAKLWLVTSRALPALLLFLVPGLSLAAPAVWFLVASWLLAFEYLDYPFAATGSGYAAQRRQLRQDALATLAFGAGVSALMVIPVLNLAAIPASVAGASLLWHQRWRRAGDAHPPLDSR